MANSNVIRRQSQRRLTQQYAEFKDRQRRAMEDRAARKAESDAAEAAKKAEAEAEAEAYVKEQTDKGYALTSGRADDIMNDPQYAAAMETYRNAMEGGPYDEAFQNAARGQFADQGAKMQQVAEQQMRRQLAASGGSIHDPAFQAAQRGLTTSRGLANQGNARDIMMQSALANFQAQQQAAGNLANVRGQQYTLSNPLASQAAEHRFQSYHQPDTKLPPVPQFRPQGSGGQPASSGGQPASSGGWATPKDRNTRTPYVLSTDRRNQPVQPLRRQTNFGTDSYSSPPKTPLAGSMTGSVTVGPSRPPVGPTVGPPVTASGPPQQPVTTPYGSVRSMY